MPCRSCRGCTAATKAPARTSSTCAASPSSTTCTSSPASPPPTPATSWPPDYLTGALARSAFLRSWGSSVQTLLVEADDAGHVLLPGVLIRPAHALSPGSRVVRFRQHTVDGRRDVVRATGIGEASMRAECFAQDRDIAGDDARARGHRLKGSEAESLVRGKVDKSLGPGVQAAHHGIRHRSKSDPGTSGRFTELLMRVSAGNEVTADADEGHAVMVGPAVPVRGQQVRQSLVRSCLAYVQQVPAGHGSHSRWAGLPGTGSERRMVDAQQDGNRLGREPSVPDELLRHRPCWCSDPAGPLTRPVEHSGVELGMQAVVGDGGRCSWPGKTPERLHGFAQRAQALVPEAGGELVIRVAVALVKAKHVVDRGHDRD